MWKSQILTIMAIITLLNHLSLALLSHPPLLNGKTKIVLFLTQSFSLKLPLLILLELLVWEEPSEITVTRSSLSSSKEFISKTNSIMPSRNMSWSEQLLDHTESTVTQNELLLLFYLSLQHENHLRTRYWRLISVFYLPLSG